MPTCEFCGHRSPTGTRVCENCGAKLPGPGPDGSGPERTADEDLAEARQAQDAFEQQLVALLQAGKKVTAVKLYREQTGTGLKEARDAVEELAARHNVVARGSGCASVLVLLLAGLAIVAAAG